MHREAGSTSGSGVPLAAPDCGGHVGPVFIEPRHGFRLVHGALKRRERGVFERLQRKPVGRVVDQFMQALVAGALLQSVGDPRADRLGADHGGSG
jgi:hypothetical protein